MTTTISKTTKYIVTFDWVAEDWNMEEEEEMDPPMTSSDPVTVVLPSNATPWDVYNKAEVLDEGPEDDPDVYSWDGDGIHIEFDGKLYSLSGYMLSPTTKWSDFSCY